MIKAPCGGRQVSTTAEWFEDSEKKSSCKVLTRRCTAEQLVVPGDEIPDARTRNSHRDYDIDVKRAHEKENVNSANEVTGLSRMNIGPAVTYLVAFQFPVSSTKVCFYFSDRDGVVRQYLKLRC